MLVYSLNNRTRLADSNVMMYHNT